MSMSKPRTAENPVTKFIQYKSSQGFFYYDKEKEEDILIDMPFYFIVLDELSSITGFHKKENTGIYSNEIHNTKTEILTVRAFKSDWKCKGFYEDIKDAAFGVGGKFTKNIYALWLLPTPELVQVKLSGAGFEGWMEKKFQAEGQCIVCKSYHEGKNGTTVYKIPEFKSVVLPDEKKYLYDVALKQDEIVQSYLSVYKSIKAEEVVEEEVTDTKTEEPVKASDTKSPDRQKRDDEFQKELNKPVASKVPNKADSEQYPF